MKKGIFYLLFLFLAATSFAQTKTDSTQSKIRGIIKINPLQIFVGELRLYYEKPLKHNMSFEISSGFIYAVFPGQLGYGLNGIAQSDKLLYWGSFGYSGRLGLKFYLNRKYDHHKFFINPLLFGNKVNYDNQLNDFYHIYSLGVQVLVGYKLNIKTPIDFYIGYGYRKIFQTFGFYNTATNHTNITKYRINYSTPQIGINIGLNMK